MTRDRPAVSAAIEDIEKSLIDHAEALNRLEQRLRPILQPDVPSPEKPNEPQPTPVSISYVLQQIYLVIDKMNRRVNGLADRLEI